MRAPRRLHIVPHNRLSLSKMAGKRRRDASAEEDTPADTTHPSRKRRVEYTETDAKLASFYNGLSDDVKSVRLRAAADLIRTLSDAEPEKLDKALNRLIRGLCSSRKAARSGFSVALTEVLRLTPKHAEATSADLDLTLPSLIDRILSATTPDVRSNSQVRLAAVFDRHISQRLTPLPRREGTTY